MQILQEVQYYADPCVHRSAIDIPLNPNHSHFLLVDNGYKQQKHSVHRFRAALEDHIAKPVKGKFAATK